MLETGYHLYIELAIDLTNSNHSGFSNRPQQRNQSVLPTFFEKASDFFNTFGGAAGVGFIKFIEFGIISIIKKFGVDDNLWITTRTNDAGEVSCE
jgi:hypothetical protein